MKELPTCSFCA